MNKSSGKGQDGRGKGLATLVPSFPVRRAILPHLAADDAWEPAGQGSSPRALRSTIDAEPRKSHVSEDNSRSKEQWLEWHFMGHSWKRDSAQKIERPWLVSLDISEKIHQNILVIFLKKYEKSIELLPWNAPKKHRFNQLN